MRQSVVLSTAVVVCILGGALLVATRGCASNPEPHPEADDGQVPAHRPEARRTRERANPSLHEPKRPDEHPSVAIAAATAPARPESATAKIAVSCGDHAVTHCRFATSLRPTDYLVIRQSPESESYEVAFPAGQHFPVTVIAYAKGFEPAEVTIDARGASVRVALPEGGTVTGRVVDAAGAPLPDGRVFLAGRQATITAGGAFRLLGVKLGEHEEFFVESGGTICPIEHSVILDAPGDSCEVELVWRADAPFDVHVVMKDDGSPVPGVTVRLSATDLMASAVASATSDVEGRVTIVGLPPGEYWCWAFGDAIDPAYVERVRVPTEAPVLLRVSSPTYHRIFGRVVDRNRRPLPGVRMSWGSEYGVVTSTTDRNGAFELKDVREIPWPTQVVSAVPPPVVIRAFRRGRDALAAMPTSFEVKWDTELELVLGEPSTWIGVVEGPPGRELPGFDLILRTSDGATYAANFRDNDDRSERKFAWGNAPGVPGVLEVRTLDGRSLQMPVTPPADGGRFDLGRLRLPVGGRLALTAGTAAELSGRAWVAWLDASTLELRAGTPLQSATLGGWVTNDVAPDGSWRILLLADGFLPADGGLRDLRAGVTTEFDVSLRRPADLTVIVVEDGAPVQGAQVSLPLTELTPVEREYRMRSRTDAHHLEGPGIRPSAPTDHRGRAWFTRLPEGTRRVSVVTATRTVQFEVDLQSGSANTTIVDLAEDTR